MGLLMFNEDDFNPKWVQFCKENGYNFWEKSKENQLMEFMLWVQKKKNESRKKPPLGLGGLREERREHRG